MLRPSRAFLFVGAVLCATLPFADRLADVGLAGFLKSFAKDERIWATAGRLVFFLVLGCTAWIPATRAGGGWIIAAVALYAYASLGCFLGVFAARDPLFGDPIQGAWVFLLMIPLLGVFHLGSLVLRDFPGWLVGFWARLELAGLIFLAGAIHAVSWSQLGGWLALTAGSFLIVGEVLARREEAFDEENPEPSE